MEDPPYLKVEQERRKNIGVDYVGLGLVALGVGCLQLVLDKGQEKDWFGSHLITTFLILGIAILAASDCLGMASSASHRGINLLKNRNFATAIFFMFVLGIVLFGTTVLIPQFLQILLGYPAVLAGEALAGGGLIMLVMMPVSGILVGKMDARYLMAFGFTITSVALYYMATHLTLGVDFKTVFFLRVFQTMGLAFIFIPTNTLSYVGIPREKNNQISSMINFIRNIGGSVGIAIISTLSCAPARFVRTIWPPIMQNGNPAFRQMIAGLTATLRAQGMSANAATRQAYERASLMLQAQATSLAYVDVISALAILVLCLVPLVFIMKKPPKMHGEAPPMH